MSGKENYCGVCGERVREMQHKETHYKTFLGMMQQQEQRRLKKYDFVIQFYYVLIRLISLELCIFSNRMFMNA